MYGTKSSYVALRSVVIIGLNTILSTVTPFGTLIATLLSGELVVILKLIPLPVSLPYSSQGIPQSPTNR